MIIKEIIIKHITNSGCKNRIFKNLYDNYIDVLKKLDKIEDNKLLSIQSHNCNGASPNGPKLKNRVLNAINGKLSDILFFQEVRLEDILEIKGITCHNIYCYSYIICYNSQIVGLFTKNVSVCTNEIGLKKIKEFKYGCLIILNSKVCEINMEDYYSIPNYYASALNMNGLAIGIKSTLFLKFKIGNKKFICISIHAPNGASNKGKLKRDIFLTNIIKECSAFINQGYIPIISGDFNALPEELESLECFIDSNGMKICNYNKNIDTHKNLQNNFSGVLDYTLIPKSYKDNDKEKEIRQIAHLVNFNEYMKQGNNDHGIIYDWIIY